MNEILYGIALAGLVTSATFVALETGLYLITKIVRMCEDWWWERKYS